MLRFVQCARRLLGTRITLNAGQNSYVAVQRQWLVWCLLCETQCARVYSLPPLIFIPVLQKKEKSTGPKRAASACESRVVIFAARR